MQASRLGATVGATVVIGLIGAGGASAAAPDGVGPWADGVAATDQKLRKDGTRVLASRSDPTAALGVAEADDAEGTFFALGFGGSVTLRFDNEICDRAGDDFEVELVEATRLPYGTETADVFVSDDGRDFVQAGEDVERDETLALPPGVERASYVKVVDSSDPAAFDGTADGYDVDGVRSLSSPADCAAPAPKGKLFGGGVTQTAKRKSVVHAIKLYCRAEDGTSQFGVASHGAWFKLTKVTEQTCSDDPALDPAPPAASFDTHTGKGKGLYNGKPATIEWKATDGGHPRRDRLRMTISDASGKVVLAVDDDLSCSGFHQAIDLP